MIKNLNRRLFLRGLGGAAVAAPFLSSVWERAARAQGVSGNGVQNRLIVMFTHYGCLTDEWFPVNSHGALTAADLTGTSLESLSPFVNKMLMPRGIRAMNEWTASDGRGQGNDPHTQVVGTFFTCVPVTPHTSDSFSFDSATKFNAKPTAPSLDHVAAQQISPQGTPLFMRVGGGTDSPQSGISYSAPEEPYAGIGDPSQVYTTLTGLFDSSGGGGGMEMTPDTYAALKGQSVIDIVRDDLDTLERFDMSQSDRDKLEAWKNLLDSTGTVIASAQCNEEMATTLGVTSSNLSSAGGGFGGDGISGAVADGMDVADIYSNVAVLAAVCNANPVIFLKYPPNYIFRGLGLEMENHSISHRIGDAGMGGDCVAGVNDMILTIDRYYAEKFAHLLGQLDSVAEGDGTVLDNTATVWFQEMSDGQAHNLNNLPIIHAGSAGGYFKTGQAVNLDGGDPALSRGNSEGVCGSNGDGNIGFNEVQSTGTPATIANAPINKYYCNLLNAIGVKADSTGHPAVGGTQEVTKYGMYDVTTDFASGGATPENITDPGEYTELRANS